MRILWIPQISSKSNDGWVLLNKDSNMAVLRNLINTKFCKDNDVSIAFEFSLGNCVLDDDIANNFTIFSNEKRTFENAFIERFCFDAAFFEKINRDADFDVVFVNEPTKVIPLKHIFKDSKVVTYNHWLAFYNMPEISLRQYEGMKAADLCFVNSDFTIREIEEYYEDNSIKLVKAQPSFVGDVLPVKKIGYADKNFIYNHRLSSDKYYASAYKSLVDICTLVESKIGEKRMPKIYFTNPSGKNFDFCKKYFKVIDLPSQNQYKEFLESDKIFGHLNTFFDSKGMWSMSTVDCARAGNVCILPNLYGYSEIFNEGYFGYCRNEMEAADKIIKLLMGEVSAEKLDNSFINNHKAEVIGEKMNEKIRRILL